MDRRLTHRAVVIAGLLLAMLTIGTLGFVLLEGYSPFNAFYMTLITISTVGYQELKPLSHAGRVFNSFVIFFGVSSMFFAVGAMTQTLIELGLEDSFGKRRTRRMIERMENHFIVCGFGRVGRSAANELSRAGVPFVVVDRSEERVNGAIQAGMTAMLADATRDEMLRAAGVNRARGLIAALAKDADNLFVILSAKTLNPGLTVVTRAAEEDAEEKLRRAGADTVFAPYSTTGHRLAQALLRPHVSQFLEFATKNIGLDVAIEQVRVAPETLLVSKTLQELQNRRELGVILLAIRRFNGEMIFNPPTDLEICAGDFLIVMGEQRSLQQFENLLTGTQLAETKRLWDQLRGRVSQ
jgi:voltage-gated potassium channel